MTQTECRQCVMSVADDPEITFDQKGICFYCRKWQSLQQPDDLQMIISQIKEAGKGKRYDCISGMSGGVDSTYVNYMLKQWGLRPLIVHFDNGWNSELAVKNVENMVRKLDFPLFTYVVDWEEFRDIQLSYFKASVLDIEFPTDHAIVALLYDIARKEGVKTIISGGNLATEGVLPHHWRWSKMDALNMISIQKSLGSKKIKSLPVLGFWKNIYMQKILGIKNVQILNAITYNKRAAKETIQRELHWRDYGGKHYESVFTRFYQGYILPRKFGVDKRRAHLSSMICSGQMTRDEAVLELQKPIYDPDQLQQDYAFVLKKWGLSAEQFESIMQQAPVSHLSFDSYLKKHYVWHQRFFQAIRPVTRWLKHIFFSVKAPA